MTSAPIQNPPSPYPPGYRPPRESGLNPWFIRIPVLFVSGGILLIAVLVMFLMAFQMRYVDRIFPGVSIMGLDLGGMTLGEARQSIAGSFRYDQEAIFTFRDGDKFWQMTANELGVSLDVDSTVEQAFAIGHDADVLTNVFYQADTWVSGYSVSPVIRYDQNIAIGKLTEIARTINRAPLDATLVVNGTQVETTNGSNGRTLDISGTLALLEQNLLQFKSGTEIPLVINETPPTIWNTDEAASKIRLALAGPITLVATDQNGAQLGPWTANIDQIAALLTVQLVDYGDGTRGYDVSVNMTAFGTFLEALAPGLIAPPKDARFHFDETSAQLVVILPSVSGRTLNVPETLKRMEEAVFSSDNRVVPMAFDFTLPRFHNQISAQELGVTEMIGEATTYFSGSSSARRTNIAVAASKFDGVIIAPGEEFSFNTVLGDINYDNGFVDAKVIYAEATTDGIGGGVCQVSTTIFRAAYQSGFPISELHSHSYRVGYYEINSPVGFDASIWQPEADFRFVNNTDYHLLIETSVFPGTDALQFRIYSTKYWRVEVEAPVIQNEAQAKPTKYIANPQLQPGQAVQVDYAANGADVTIARKIYGPDGQLINRETIPRHYEAWGAAYEVAPNDSRLSQ